MELFDALFLLCDTYIRSFNELQGDEADCMYFIENGEVRVTVKNQVGVLRCFHTCLFALCVFYHVSSLAGQECLWV